MKRMAMILLGYLLSAVVLPAQDPSVVERVNRLSVYVEELLADRAQHQKQIDDLTREVASLREQLAAARGSARSEDVSSLAEAIREVDKKRQADRELILKEIEKLGTTLSSRPKTEAAPEDPKPRRGYEYTVNEGDTLSAIVDAYRAKGVKVTVDQVLKANPGLKPTSLRVGQTIFIPQP